jgi:hypothetical protein
MLLIAAIPSHLELNPNVLAHMQCFFPQNIIGSINTPIFLLNAAYDTWQV